MSNNDDNNNNVSRESTNAARCLQSFKVKVKVSFVIIRLSEPIYDTLSRKAVSKSDKTFYTIDNFHVQKLGK